MIEKRNYVPGTYEQVTLQKAGTIVSGSWQYFILDDVFKFPLADINVFYGPSHLPVASGKYVLAIDSKYTSLEATLTAKTLYAEIKFVDISLNGFDFYVTAKSFGTYTDNEAVKNYVDRSILSKADLVNGVVPAAQLPSYVDDVLEFPDLSSFPATGEMGKIYIAVSPAPSRQYRWSGTMYADMTQGGSVGDIKSLNVSDGSGGWVDSGIFVTTSTPGTELIGADTSLTLTGGIGGRATIKDDLVEFNTLSGTKFRCLDQSAEIFKPLIVYGTITHSNAILDSQSATLGQVKSFVPSIDLQHVLSAGKDGNKIGITNLGKLDSGDLLLPSTGKWQASAPLGTAGAGFSVTQTIGSAVSGTYTEVVGTLHNGYKVYKSGLNYICLEGWWWLICTNINDSWNTCLYYGAGGLLTPSGYYQPYNGNTGNVTVMAVGATSVDTIVSEGSIYSDTTVKAKLGVNVAGKLLVLEDRISMADGQNELTFHPDGTASLEGIDLAQVTFYDDILVKGCSDFSWYNANQIQSKGVDSTIPTTGQALIFNGSIWSPTTLTNGAVWGSIIGTLSNQNDLLLALNTKANTAHTSLTGSAIGQGSATYFGHTMASSTTPLVDNTTGGVGTDNGKYAREGHYHPTDSTRAPVSHASSATTYGAADGNNYGHVKIGLSAPAMNGTANAGTSTTVVSMADHVHPSDTTKQTTLVSSTNIKTVNSVSLLGSGDLVVDNSYTHVVSSSSLISISIISPYNLSIFTGSSAVGITSPSSDMVAGMWWDVCVTGTGSISLPTQTGTYLLYKSGGIVRVFAVSSTVCYCVPPQRPNGLVDTVVTSDGAQGFNQTTAKIVGTTLSGITEYGTSGPITLAFDSDDAGLDYFTIMSGSSRTALFRIGSSSNINSYGAIDLPSSTPAKIRDTGSKAVLTKEYLSLTTPGDTLYLDSNNLPVRLAKGTQGQVLTMNTGATAPVWATPSGGSTNLKSTVSLTGQQFNDGSVVTLTKTMTGAVMGDPVVCTPDSTFISAVNGMATACSLRMFAYVSSSDTVSVSIRFQGTGCPYINTSVFGLAVIK